MARVLNLHDANFTLERKTAIRAIATVFIAFLLLLATEPPASIPPASASNQPVHTDAKKSCRIVTKKVHGKKKRVKVCFTPPPAPAVMPVISRGAPAFASPNLYPYNSASNANDNDFGTGYRSTGAPAWVAYDLSAVSPAHRQKVLAVYYNNSYAYSTIHGGHYNDLGAYTIDANAASGGGPPPAAGWLSLVSVTGNTLHSRQHVIDLTGYNWVRINVTVVDGSPGNSDAAFSQFDLYDLSTVGKPTDDWIFYGDSITANCMVTYPDGVASLAELIHEADPTRWPVIENGGEPFDTSVDALHRILGASSNGNAANNYLSIFPGRYVALSYGMNDAAYPSDGKGYFRNMKQLVQAVLAAGKIPIIPKISYTNDPAHNANIPVLNSQIERLYKQYPQIVKGPDFWSYFQQHTELVGQGDIHPNGPGCGEMRKLWSATLLTEVYRKH